MTAAKKRMPIVRLLLGFGGPAPMGVTIAFSLDLSLRSELRRRRARPSPDRRHRGSPAGPALPLPVAEAAFDGPRQSPSLYRSPRRRLPPSIDGKNSRLIVYER